MKPPISLKKIFLSSLYAAVAVVGGCMFLYWLGFELAQRRLATGLALLSIECGAFLYTTPFRFYGMIIPGLANFVAKFGMGAALALNIFLALVFYWAFFVIILWIARCIQKRNYHYS